jgi:hypothetical protein
MAVVLKTNGTGTGAIATSHTARAGTVQRLISVSVNFNAAPATSESLTITLNANAGAAYDVLLYAVNPAAGATSDIVWTPEQPVYLVGGDAVDVAFTNTDGRTYGVEITVMEV